MIATYAFPSTPQEVAGLEMGVRDADPGAALTGLPLVNRELADRFLPQFVKGLSIGIDRRDRPRGGCLPQTGG